MSKTSSTFDRKVSDLPDQFQAQASAAEKSARTLEQAALLKAKNDEQGPSWAVPTPLLTVAAGLAWLAVGAARLLLDHPRGEEVISREFGNRRQKLSLGSVLTTFPGSLRNSRMQSLYFSRLSTSVIGSPHPLFTLTFLLLLCVVRGAGETESGGAGSVVGLRGVERKALEGVAGIVVSGMCAVQSGYNGVYEPIALTASGKPWYRNENGRALYWDPDCNGGESGNVVMRWIFNEDEPSVIAESNLDGDGCTYEGRINSFSDRPPSGSNDWRIICGGSWTSVSITIVDVAACPVGQGPQLSGDGCDICPEGKYCDSLSPTFCSRCPAGRYNPSLGSESAEMCIPCAAGEGNSEGSASCTPCQPGTFSAESGEDCSQCPAGKYSDNAGTVSCIFCGAGKGSAQGSYACTSCIGGFSSGDGDCVLCEVGDYSDTLGSISVGTCQACGSGMSSAPGATSSSSCYSVATGQSSFYNLISQNGNNKMAPGGKVIVSVGTFKCGTCHSQDRMYYLSNMYGSIACEAVDEGGCVQDGESESGRVMVVQGTSGQTLMIRGLTFHRGSYSVGGGLLTLGDAIVTLINCAFTQNSATNSELGGAGIDAATGSVNLYTTRFESNLATSGNFIDMMVENGVITIFPTCADGSGGSPNEQSDLDTGIRPGFSGTFAGTYLKSYTKGTCSVCPAGTAPSENGLSCDACPTGKYSDEPGSLTCSACPAGTFDSAIGASTYCTTCPAGKFSEDQGESTCEECDAGKYRSEPGASRRSDCLSCEAGKYNSLAGADGATICEFCGAGFRANKDTHQCEECDFDTYSVGGSDSCLICPAGTDNKGSSSCSPCPPGTITLGNTCQPCAKGEYADFGDTSCSACSGQGEYSDVEGSAVCKIATVGMKPNLNRDGVTQCDLGSASFGAQDECTPCNGDGQYADELGLSACKLAPAGYKPTSNRESIEKCPKNTFSIGASDDCTNCVEGGHSRPGSSACEKCSTGKYYDEVANACELCPKNTFTISGATDISGCALCEDGGHSQPGSGYCEKCSTGKYYNEPDNTCKDCPKNTASISGAADISGCGDCQVAVGEYAAPGSGYCSSCSSGKYFDEPQNVCISCPSGMFTATGAIGIWQCATCQVGFYSSSPGSSTCFTCNPGKYTNAEQTECLSCPAGKVAGVASSSCSVCEEGKYASGEANSECLACRAGKYANADKTNCISCPAGKFSGIASSECAVCETGKYAEGEGNVECRFCDDWDVIKGSVTLSNGTKSSEGCICPAGEFRDDATYSCEKVVEGVKMYVAGMNVTTLDLEPGYWRTKSSSRVVTKCMSTEHCLGGSNASKQCKTGHQGPLCGVCSPGYASVGSGSSLKCVTCSGGDAKQTISVYSVLLFLCLVACIAMSKFASEKSEERKELKRAGSSREALDKVDKVAEKIENFQPYAKILTSYLQIVTGLGFALDLAFPPLITNLFDFFGFIFNLDFLSLMPVGCLSTYNYHRRLVVTTAGPLLLSILMMIWYKALIKARKHKAANALFGWFLFLSFLVLPSVSTMIFYNFACKDFDGDYGSYLKVDLSIDCNSAEHKLFSVYAFFTILVYPLGIPAMYMALLYRKRNLVNPGADRKISTEAALEEREINEEKFANLLSIGFLYSSYEPTYYYFELIETARKLLLTGALVLFGPGTYTQIVIAMVICVAMIKILNISKPYHKKHHNIFHEIMQWQIFFVLLAAMMIKFEELNPTGDSGGIPKSPGFDTMLVCMQGIGPVLMVIIVMISLKDKGKKALEKRRQKRQMQQNEKELTSVGIRREGSGFVAENPMVEMSSKSFFASDIDEAQEKARMANLPRNTPAAQNKAEKGLPNSSFNTFKNPNLVIRGKGGSKKNKKNIEKEAPKRKSMFSIPKEHLEDAPIGPPKIPSPIQSDSDDDDDDVGPPPFPPPAAEASLPPPKPVCQWTEEWDAEFGAIYYLNIDGYTSTWDMPDDFWREEKR
ncbi:hypothetical protein TrST_g6997 [Triparma strigata]|uniref:WW domain-containing protein n=1 Tax=Triparma strigata TaxID=1606541 RepID=A0A9W7C0X9_9STRA|nr:hypothetical protein TrST_g6997 [Triparma strigata]